MNGDGQSNSQKAVFSSDNIDSSKARTKTNYFVNLRRGSAIDKLSQKIDQKKFYDEVEAKKRAEAEAAQKEKDKEAAALSADRFTKKESEIKVPTFVKMQGGAAPAPAPKPVAPRPIVEQPSRPQPIAPIQPQPIKNPKNSKKIIYIVCAAITFVAAAAFIIWSFIPQEITVSKRTPVAKPSTEKTLLDEITEKRLEIMEIIESNGVEAGLNAYADYISTVTDSKTLALVRSWRALDLYRLYRGQYASTILEDVYAAEELNPTKGTATLIYSFEHEFGDPEKSKTYYDLATTRKETSTQPTESESDNLSDELTVDE